MSRKLPGAVGKTARPQLSGTAKPLGAWFHEVISRLPACRSRQKFMPQTSPGCGLTPRLAKGKRMTRVQWSADRLPSVPGRTVKLLTVCVGVSSASQTTPMAFTIQCQTHVCPRAGSITTSTQSSA